jgi:roadblock/LC7 domain-containing protein
MAYPYLIQGSNIVVVIGNKSHTISKTHITYNKVLEAIKTGDWDSLPDIIEPKKVVLNYGAGNVSIQGETLFWKGKELNTGLSVRMIQMLQEGFPIEPMVNFMENLYKNPSHRAVTELYGFLEKNNLPITPDGHFLAYKKVRDNYLDVHSGTMDNSVGNVVEMERHEVNDNKDITCSTGLHFCGMSYLSCFGGERTVIVKINPADVVSIPSDYNEAKGRACRYEVIGEVDADKADQAFTRPVQSNSNNYNVPAKEGDTPFKQGYSNGYKGLYNALDDFYGKERLMYRDGYEMGRAHVREGIPERYRYVKAQPNVQVGAWPFPNKG